MNTIKTSFLRTLPVIVGLTGLFGFSYLAVQQNYRQSMNDPQIEMAESAASALAVGDSPVSVLTPGASGIDASVDLAPWIAVYDASGKTVLASTALDSSARLPPSLFDTSSWQPLKHFVAPSGPETRVTWESKGGVRQAVVLVQYHTSEGLGWVASGRSMRVVEDRIINLTQLAAIAWSVSILAMVAVSWFLSALGWL